MTVIVAAVGKEWQKYILGQPIEIFGAICAAYMIKIGPLRKKNGPMRSCNSNTGRTETRHSEILEINNTGGNERKQAQMQSAAASSTVASSVATSRRAPLRDAHKFRNMGVDALDVPVSRECPWAIKKPRGTKRNKLLSKRTSKHGYQDLGRNNHEFAVKQTKSKPHSKKKRSKQATKGDIQGEIEILLPMHKQLTHVT
ncbi:hypothetical protein C8R45DRAFT_948391 [Mycena sanguinolenta]|nr:hypothetical protein C8R45DRAFT_948391 [Mycena sanguinolenta]